MDSEGSRRGVKIPFSIEKDVSNFLLMPTIPVISLCIAGAAVVATPLTTWLITGRQLAHNERMQKLRLQHEEGQQKRELAFRSDRDWCNALRERVSLLIGLSTDVLFSHGAQELRVATNEFSTAQAQVDILVSNNTNEHKALRRLVTDLAILLRKADVRSLQHIDDIAKVRREIVDATRDIVELTLSQNYSSVEL